MKILYICPYLPLPNINAGQTRMFELIKRLSVKNDVSVISFLSEKDEKFTNITERICERLYFVRKNYPWRPDRLSVLPAMIEEYSCDAMRTLVRGKLKEEKFDIIHCEYLIMAQYAPEGRTSIKFLTEHEVHFLAQLRDLKVHKGCAYKVKAFWGAIKKMIYEINVCRRFDRVITMTEREAAILGSWLQKKNVISLPMGVDHKAFFPLTQEREDIDIIFTGFFGHYPNVDAVLYFYNSILPLVRKKIPDVKFTVVGSEPPDSILSLRSDKDITVTGHVDDIRLYLSRSKVFVMPLRLGYGMRGKLFEAWGMGKAVVSTSVGCEGVSVSKGGNILIADEPEAFAESVISLLIDEEKRKELGGNARKSVEELYNWDNIAHSLERMYLESLKGC